MSAHDQSRYYWIKIKTDFLTSKEFDFLMRQKGGSDYVVLYQSLCLLAINNGGVLADKIGEILVPYDDNKIHGLTKGWFSIDTVRVGLTLFAQLGLVYENEEGILKLANFESLVGSETFGAERKRRKALQLKGGNTVENFHQDNKSLEYRDVDSKNLDTKPKKEEKNNESIDIDSLKKDEHVEGDLGNGKTRSDIPF